MQKSNNLKLSAVTLLVSLACLWVVVEAGNGHGHGHGKPSPQGSHTPIHSPPASRRPLRPSNRPLHTPGTGASGPYGHQERNGSEEHNLSIQEMLKSPVNMVVQVAPEYVLCPGTEADASCLGLLWEHPMHQFVECTLTPLVQEQAASQGSGNGNGNGNGNGHQHGLEPGHGVEMVLQGSIGGFVFEEGSKVTLNISVQAVEDSSNVLYVTPHMYGNENGSGPNNNGSCDGDCEGNNYGGNQSNGDPQNHGQCGSSAEGDCDGADHGGQGQGDHQGNGQGQGGNQGSGQGGGKHRRFISMQHQAELSESSVPVLEISVVVLLNSIVSDDVGEEIGNDEEVAAPSLNPEAMDGLAGGVSGTSTSSAGLSAGAIAGILVGALAAAAVVVAGIVVYNMRRRAASQQRQGSENA
mmetsp:Transcript_21697/g.37347  ORF Transcript_21697/g.37347 Transcript_21697/m.37347 type:complete len:410 (+) Transcript_21697:474-1703(+)